MWVLNCQVVVCLLNYSFEKWNRNKNENKTSKLNLLLAEMLHQLWHNTSNTRDSVSSNHHHYYTAENTCEV